MGRPACLPEEALSAFLDGELSELDARRAADHVRSCPACTADLAAFSRLDAALLTPPALSCAAALPLLSAHLDGEAAPTELAVAETHLASCGSCRGLVAGWERVEAAFVAMPEAQPSASVDAAIRGLVDRRARRERRVAFANAMALRAAVAVTLVAAVVALATLQPAGQNALQSPPDGQVVVVAAAQQILLNPRTNTLYVAHPDDGTVNALDASTQQDIATIVVGGRPSALALNEAENRILVLDSIQKTLTEIDGSTNRVVSSTPIDVAGTLTSIQVEPASGKIVLASVQARTPSQAASSSAATGEVTVINGQSKKIESTTSAPVGPSSVMVIDADSQQTLLVSEDVTTVLDDKWKVTNKLPGGIAAVFAAGGKAIAVLSATSGGAQIAIHGDGAGTVSLPGRPLALIALPLGGYAALTDIGGGKSQIVEISATGVLGKTQDVNLLGREFMYSAGTKTYVVAGDRGIWTGSIANPVVSAPQIVSPSPSPSPSAPVAAASPGPSASPVASPGASPTAPSQRAAAGAEPNVVNGATLAWPRVYHFDLVGRGAPSVVGRGTGSRLWFVDSANKLSALDAATGNVFTIWPLPSDARIRSIEVGSKYVYAIDVAASSVYVVQLASEKVSEIKLPFVKSSAAVAVTPDDVLWFAVADQILRLDPRTGKIEAANVGLYNVSAMAADTAGRVWFSDEARQTINLYDRTTHRVEELALPRGAAVSSMVVDGDGTLWVGTEAAEIFAVRNNVIVSSARLGRPVVELSLDGRGNAWFLTNDGSSAGFGRGTDPAAAQLMPASVVGLWFDAKANAWLADRTSAGFFIALPEPKP